MVDGLNFVFLFFIFKLSPSEFRPLLSWGFAPETFSSIQPLVARSFADSLELLIANSPEPLANHVLIPGTHRPITHGLSVV